MHAVMCPKTMFQSTMPSDIILRPTAKVANIKKAVVRGQTAVSWLDGDVIEELLDGS